jgi:hypothetical protein
MKNLFKNVTKNATTITTIYLVVMLLSIYGVLAIPEAFFNSINGALLTVLFLCDMAIIVGYFKYPGLLLTAIKNQPVKELNKHQKFNKVLDTTCILACLLGSSVYSIGFTAILVAGNVVVVAFNIAHRILCAVAEVAE